MPEIAHLFPSGKPSEPLTLRAFEDAVIHMKDYRNRYNDYWMSSADKTHTGRSALGMDLPVVNRLVVASGHPVEAVSAPVTSPAGIRPGKFKYCRKPTSRSQV